MYNMYFKWYMMQVQICNNYSLMLQMYQINVLDFSKIGLNNKNNI